MKKIKKVFVCLMAVTSLAVGMTGISASAYYDTASMIIRNVPGAASGNITSACLTINSKAGKATYYTSCDFLNGTNATLTVSTANAQSVTLDKNNRTASIVVEARYSYITFCGKLSSFAGESCIWSVS